MALPAVAVDALAEHIAQFTPAGPDALVFGTKKGTPVSSGSRSVMFARARRAIGRDDLTWHDQRHSSMTMVASTGATLHYQHAADDAPRRIADRLDDALGTDRRGR